MPLTDTSPMPFGKHQGDDMEDVPASYLLYLYESPKGIQHRDLLKYVEDNYQGLEQERTKKPF